MNPFTWISKQSFFKDRQVIMLGAASVGALAVTGIYSLLNIERQGFKIPVRYSDFSAGTLSDRDEWFLLYAFPLFALVTTVFNTVLSIRVHGMRPEFARVLLILNLIVAAFTFIVLRALINLT